MTLEDRVRCRLRLRYEELEELENFFPEECKVREDSDLCLRQYQAVQDCWDFPNNASRFNCARKELNLGDIPAEKRNCNALAVGQRENCNRELKSKVYDMIKFRLYNLEIEAEELQEQGRLTEDDVVDFVVRVENNKAAFNQATSKEERRTIILRVRQDWIALLKKLTPGDAP